MRLISTPILIVLERGQRYIMYCDASRTWMRFDAVRESSGLWFSIVKEPRTELPHA